MRHSTTCMKAKAGNQEADRHYRKYLTETITELILAKQFPGIPVGATVKYSDKKEIEGTYHALVSYEDRLFEWVPISRFYKPVPPKGNKGLSYEKDFVSHLKSHGLMDPEDSGAGYTAGNDFYLLHRRLSEGRKFQGEVKESLKADFGQLTLQYDDGRQRWYISDEGRTKRPLFAEAIEKATILGESLLDFISETVGAPVSGQVTKANYYSDATDLYPIHAYCTDHHADILHVGSHGTYRVGLSICEGLDDLNLTIVEGKGRFRVRGKHPTGKLVVSFMPVVMEKSVYDIHKDPEYFKSVLGGNAITEVEIGDLIREEVIDEKVASTTWNKRPPPKSYSPHDEPPHTFDIEAVFGGVPFYSEHEKRELTGER